MWIDLATSTHRRLQEAALSLLDSRGPVLDTAREVSKRLEAASLTAIVVGGVAVVLHGHLRTTKDVDIFVPGDAREVANSLIAAGFAHDPIRREFVRDLIPVHLVIPEQVGVPEIRSIELDGIRTASLADLIAMKLRSGLENLLRAQGLADVIGLARHHKITSEFSSCLDTSLRPGFRKIARALRDERPPIR